MSTKDSSKTGSKPVSQIIEENLVFGNNPHMGGGKFKKPYPKTEMQDPTDFSFVPPEEGGDLPYDTWRTEKGLKEKVKIVETHSSASLKDKDPEKFERIRWKMREAGLKRKLDVLTGEPLADRWKWTFQGEPPYMSKDEGIKEKDGKVTYNEIDWDFIDDMSDRMDANTKYPPLNYQKGMDVVELAKAVLRHARKIIQPIPEDPETIKDHIEAIGTNAMMMNYQVKNKVKEK